jgi:two-component system, NtrC family, sensor kinase
LIDTSGKQLAYVGPFPDRTKAREYSDTPWFNEVLVRGTYVSDVFTGSQNHPQFVVALTDPLKTFVLRATINSYIFNSLLHSAQIGPSGDAFILNSNGEFQTPSLQKSTSLTDIEIRMLKQRQDTEILSDEEYFYSGRWLKDNVWLLVIKTRITDSLDQFYNYRNSIFLIIFATCNAFLLISIWISRVIVSRVEEADREQKPLIRKFPTWKKWPILAG